MEALSRGTPAFDAVDAAGVRAWRQSLQGFVIVITEAQRSCRVGSMCIE